MKTIINTAKAGQPIGPYNQAILVNGMLFVSGNIAINPQSGELVLDTIEAETHQVLSNISAILAEAGMNFTNVVKTSIFLKDMNQFAAVNAIYATYFTSDFPARETVQVAALPKNVNVEISVIAVAK